MTVHLSKRDRAKVGEHNLANIASEEIALRLTADDRIYEVRRLDLLNRAVALASDIEDLLSDRPANIERLTIAAALAGNYPLRKQLERIRGLEAAVRGL